jgi:hypothetical protein
MNFPGFSWQDVTFFSFSFTPSFCDFSLRPDATNSRQNCNATISRYYDNAGSPQAQSQGGILKRFFKPYFLVPI